MYGLFLMSIKEYVVKNCGLIMWKTVNSAIGVNHDNFTFYYRYPDEYFHIISDECIKMLKISEEEFFEKIGKHLIIFLKENNCNQVLLVLGKHFRDFLNGLDNLYDYLNFLLPEIKSLSFVCEKESATGLRLNYQCSKIFLAYYTVGIIKQTAREYYNKELLIQVEFEEYLTDLVRITYNLIFDNEEFNIASYPFILRRYNSLPISPHLILQIFPFGILFRKDLIIKHFGTSLYSLLAYAIGNKMSKYFKIIKPSMPFHFRNIQSRVSSTFELETINPVKSYRQMTSLQDITHIIQHKVTLKGQMVFVEEWDMMLFLGTPVMPDLEYVSDIGLYMNDLSMHDFSRDLMLAGTQQSATLRLALEQEQEKTMKLEDSLARLSEERRRTDQLLYQMIPESVADTLRKGLSPMKTCKKFNNVSILYSDVVKFTEICSKITAMEVVSMLNGMYSIFDSLTEQLKVFKVETIGDAYTVVSGAPDHAFDHAARIANLALNMVKAIKTMHDPSTGSHLKIRIGIHSGPVVAGIVGMKMPRYCLFGETASIASLMESTSKPMKIHITEAVQKLLPHDFITSDNFKVDVTRQTNLKNCKGLTKTFWLEDRLNVCNVRITEETIN